MPYVIKEIYRTLCGEGAQVGRAAVFLRFAGCKLWSGREEDRGRFATAAELAAAVARHWPAGQPGCHAVCTGGEPLLQLDDELIGALHGAGFTIAVETNGTLAVPSGLDWVAVSPKAGTELVARSGDELKLVYPQPGAEPERFERLAFGHFFLQPLDGPARQAHTEATLRYCLGHPHWRLSLQVHKLLGIP